MSSTLNKLLYFTIGAAVGSLVTWKLIDVKYERRAQEEIEFVRERFEKKYNKEANKDGVVLPGRNEKPSISEYTTMLNELGYSRDEYGVIRKKDDVDINEEVNEMYDVPHVISPEEFDDHGDYEVETLTYYADGVLTDWYDEPIDAEEYVGADALTRFGEYEKDTVYVRNDTHGYDYEIQRDLSNYFDDDTHLVEG